MIGVYGLSVWLKVTDVENGQSVVHKAVQGAVRTVRILVDQAGDEVRGEGDDKSLRKEHFLSLLFFRTGETAASLCFFGHWSHQAKHE